MSFTKTLNSAFPGAIPDNQFIDASVRVTRLLGFTDKNTLACVAVCRDEMCQPLAMKVRASWGEAFRLGSLGGMFFSGRTGLRAAHSHAPVENGRTRYAYFCMPHIGIDASGRVGYCTRPTQPNEVSAACGALCALHSQIERGDVDSELDRDDLEQSLLTQRLMKEVPSGEKPDLVQLTKLAGKTIEADLVSAIDSTVDSKKADYAVFMGVQVHAPDGRGLVWPTSSYAIVDGERHDFTLSGEGAPT